MYLNILRLVLFQVDNYYDNNKNGKRSEEYRSLIRYIISTAHRADAVITVIKLKRIAAL